MDSLDLLLHLLSFLAPAAAVALLVAAASSLLVPRNQAAHSWRAQAAINFAAGAVILAAGLWWWGVDGKMATYGTMVAVIATCQWIGSRAWRA
jgi:hypothetical protein